MNDENQNTIDCMQEGLARIKPVGLSFAEEVYLLLLAKEESSPEYEALTYCARRAAFAVKVLKQELLKAGLEEDV